MIEKLSKNQWRVIDYFIRKPGEEIHIRGLTDELDISYSSVRDALEALNQRGLLDKSIKGNLSLYSVSNPEFRELKKLRNLEKVRDSGLVDYLDRELRPEAIILFGSYLEGKDHEESDIDIAVVAGRKKELNFKSYERKLGRKIHLINIKELKNEEDEFKNTLANGYILKGYIEVL